MVSRMEKYYKNNNNIKQRSQKNKDLYRNIYDFGEYSNIEGIAAMNKNNEIDITKVQNMLKNRENYKKQKQFRKAYKEDNSDISISNDFVESEQKNYDIRDILNKAKEKKPIEDTPRRLDNTNYNILKNLEVNKNYKDFEDDELKELIDTITNTSMLNQMNDNELGLNMLDLNSTNDTLIKDDNSIKQLLEEAKKAENNKTSSIPSIDNSFYTSSLNFSKEDFEEANNLVNKGKSKKILFRILIFIGLIILTSFVILIIYNLIK